MHGESYKSFILGKLIPIAGNVHETNLGMGIVTAHQIAEEIDLIIDSAANTTFDERFFIYLLNFYNSYSFLSQESIGNRLFIFVG